MKKLQGFNQCRHKTLQILKNLIFSSFVLIQKKQKIKAYTSRRPTNGSTANGINVALRLVNLCQDKLTEKTSSLSLIFEKYTF
jgi:hypothetical protein